MSTEHLRGEIVGLTARNDALTKELEAATVRAVDSRAALIMAARTLVPGLRTDGLTDDQVRRAALAATGSNLTGMDSDYVAGLFAARTVGARREN